MPRKSLWALPLVLLLLLGLIGCGQAGRQDGMSTPVVVASPGSGTAPTTVIILPSSTPAPVPTITPMPVPTITATLVPTTTPIPVLPSDTPLSSQASATPTPLLPTTTPTPRPTPTPTPDGSPIDDPAAIRVELKRVVGGLESPVGITHAVGGRGWLFVVEKVGRIRVVRDGTLSPVPFLDITGRTGSSKSEQGLLGLAFHPGYAQNGFFFVNYTDREGDTVVSRFSVSADPALADPASEAVVLMLDQPAANHNGGHLAFGPDGYLYIGTGDGGGAGDQFRNGQNGMTLLGAMLRLDVDGSLPYSVPVDNPFVGDPALRDEIWAIGLRNPWRFSFDRLTGHLYTADVGQNTYEEVNFLAVDHPGGQNYGWPIMEGMHCFPEDRSCDRSGLTPPVVEYDHSLGCSVTGGYVYRGQEFPILTGIYLFGDYCSGRIWGLASTGDAGWQLAELAQADLRLSSFGEDETGELYLVDMGQGALFKITARPR
jgi:glucose/arabinose dehydrogenase